MDLCQEGAKTYPQRQALFVSRLEAIDEQIPQLERIRAMLEFKIFYYEVATEDGNEDGIAQMIQTRSLPEAIQKQYDLAHPGCSSGS